MKILITSDWHLDYWRGDARDPLAESGYIFEEADALILAGDLAEDPLRIWPTWLERISRRIDPAKVFLVLDDGILRHRPDLWLCGHSHRRLHGQAGPTAIHDVSLGYPWEVRDGHETDLLLRGLIDTKFPELLAI